LHAELYSSKLPPLTREYLKQDREALPNEPRRGAGPRGEQKLGRSRIDDVDVRRESRWQVVPQVLQNREFAPATVRKAGERRFGR
jgi:hypothetical protein